MAKADKKVTLSLLVGTDIDVAAASSVAKKLSNILQKSGVNTAFSGKVVKDLEALSAKAEQLFKYEFSDKNPKQLQYMKKELDSFVSQMNSISDDINGAELVEALLPQAIFETKIREIEKEFKESKSRITSAHKKDKSSPLYDKNIAQMTVKAQSDIKVKYEKEASAVEELNRKLKENVDILEARYSALSKEEKKSDKGLTLEKNLQTAKEGLELSKKEHDQLLSRNREFREFFRAFSTYKKEISAVTAAKEKQVTLAKEERKIAESKVTPAGKPVELESATNEFGQFKREVSETQASLESHNKELGKTSESAKYLGQQLARVTSLTFLVAKGFQGLRAAVNIVKDLDEAMTGIAIVTNQTREKVWGAYDSFKALADSLSATTQEIADAALLYYQQGLNTAEVMDVVKSTTIAAALAGIQFAEASDRMTAAIRGFDMEMSDSIHATDTFSSLAAYTAADFNELSYAMTKTASIAHTANMSFENTTAFLAKMIETTREAPENIGTAMKSIVARMAELKKNPLQSLEDGTDFNRVETALKTVNIELRNSQSEMRDFDEVFIELGQKWELIDRNTQSYIATMIAGNRQQSRFLALMSDFDRTMDMVAMANNSAGESMQMFNTYITGAQAASKRFKQSQIDLANSFVDSNFIITVTDSMTGFLKVLSSIGPIGTSLVAVMSLLTASYIKNQLHTMTLAGSKSFLAIATGKNTFLTKAEIAATVEEQLANKAGTAEIVKKTLALQLEQSSLVKSITTIIKGIAARRALSLEAKKGIAAKLGNVAATTVETKALEANVVALNKERIAAKKDAVTQLSLLAARLAASAALLAGTAAAMGAIYLIYRLVTARKKYIESLKEEITLSNEKADAFKNENLSLESLMKRYTDLSEKISLSQEEKEELLQTEQELLEYFPDIITGYDTEGNAIADNTVLLETYTKRIKENTEAKRKNLENALQNELQLMAAGDWGDLFTEEENKKMQAAKAIRGAGYGASAGPSTVETFEFESKGVDKQLNEVEKRAKAYSRELGLTIVEELEIKDPKIKSKMNSYAIEVIDGFYAAARDSAGDNPEVLSSMIANMGPEVKRTVDAMYALADVELERGGNLFAFGAKQLTAMDSGSLAEIKQNGNKLRYAIQSAIAAGDVAADDPAVQNWLKIINEKIDKAEETLTEFENIGIDTKKIENAGTSTLSAFLKAYQNSDTPSTFAALIGQIGDELNEGPELQEGIEKAFAENDTRTIEGLANIKKSLEGLGLSNETLEFLIDNLGELEGLDFSSVISHFDKVQNKIEKTAELSEKMITEGGLNSEEINELTILFPELEIESTGNGFAVDTIELFDAQKAYLQQSAYEMETLQGIQLTKTQDYIRKINDTYGSKIPTDNLEKAKIAYLELMEGTDDPELLTELEILHSQVKDTEASQEVFEEFKKGIDDFAKTNLKNTINSFEKLTEKIEILNKAQSELNGSNSLTVETLEALIDNDLLQYLELTEDGLRLAEGATEALNEATLLNIKLELFRAMNEELMQQAMDGTIETSKNVVTQNEKEAASWATLTNEIIKATAAEIEHKNGPGSADAYLEEAKKKAAGLAKITFSSFGGGGGGGGRSGSGGSGSKQKIEIDPYYRYVDALQAIEKELGVIIELEEKFEDDQVMLARLAMQKIQVLQKQQRALHAANEARRVDIRSNIEQLRAFGLEVEYHADTNDLMISNLEMLEGRSDAAAEAIYKLVGATKELNDTNEEGSVKYRGINKEIKDATPTFEELFNRFKESEIDRLGWVQDDINFLRRKDEDILKWTEKIEEVEEKILEKRAKSLEITEEEREIFIEKFGFMEHDIELLNEAELSYVEINRQIVEQKKLLQDLNNEKNKAVYHEDMGWVWETDQDAITKAEEDMDKLEIDLMKASVDVYNSEIDDKNKIYDDSVETLQERMDDLRYEVDVTSRKIEFSYEDLVVHMHAYGLATKENLEMVSKSYDKNKKAIQTSTDDLAKGLQTTVEKLVQRINELAGTANFDFGGGNVQYGPPGSKETNIGPTIHSTGSGYKSGDAKPGDYVATAGGIYRVNDKGVGEKIPNLGGVNVNASDSDWKSKVNESADELRKKLKFKEGGIVDYTGDAAVHGSKTKPEVVFNSTDAKKLYDLVHNTDSLIPKIANSFDFQNGVPTNNIYNFDQLVLPNVKDGESFMSDLKRIRNIVSITGKN